MAYVKCAQNAQARNLERRDNSLSNLVMPDGRTIMYSKAARAKIPASVIDGIQERNFLDLALHARAEVILL